MNELKKLIEWLEKEIPDREFFRPILTVVLDKARALLADEEAQILCDRQLEKDNPIEHAAMKLAEERMQKPIAPDSLVEAIELIAKDNDKTGPEGRVIHAMLRGALKSYRAEKPTDGKEKKE